MNGRTAILRSTLKTVATPDCSAFCDVLLDLCQCIAYFAAYLFKILYFVAYVDNSDIDSYCVVKIGFIEPESFTYSSFYEIAVYCFLEITLRN